MIAKREILETILSQCPLVPPEIGGIIGGHGELITDVFFDTNSCLKNRAIYHPDVDYLNSRIAWWESHQVEFRGIFHSHPSNQSNLSGDDCAYIVEIMSAMPESVTDLFFPIVIPRESLCVYRARRDASKIIIQNDYLKII